MAKDRKRVIYLCEQCGNSFPKWIGRCLECGSWNSLVEKKIEEQTLAINGQHGGYALGSEPITRLSDIDSLVVERWSTSSSELDRVLGGGLVIGSTVLLGGDPGVGKSTLLLQVLCHLSQKHKVVYVSGEESLQQIAMRARRLALPEDQLLLLAETCLERIFERLNEEQPTVVAIDSVQTIFTEQVASAPGGSGQIRECAAKLVRYAKQKQIALFIVGHVTKEGSLAGPRILEHVVDSVLYFEGEQDSRFRIIRAVKNRFGAVNELGIFVMSDRGLKEVLNPSAIFLANQGEASAGSSTMVIWEGSRALLVEIQALVDESYLSNPRRIAVGFDSNRLVLLLAVLNRHGHITTYNRDVFVNVVGGLRVNETAVDLPLILAIVSSINSRPLPRNLISFGEVGLSGEIRPVPNGQERIKVAIKQGFNWILLPKANMPKELPDSRVVTLVAVAHLSEVLTKLAKLTEITAV